MQKKIEQFCKLNSDIHKSLNISGNIYLSEKLKANWKIIDLGELKMVEYEQNGNLEKCVVVNNDKRPIIIKEGKYTVVVVIDCVKVAFIFDNSLEKK